MAKFYGAVGYAIPTVTSPGVFEEIIVENNAYGNVVRDAMNLQTATVVNADITMGNAFSIVMDEFSSANFSAMRYIKWMGKPWRIRSVEVRAPRLLVRIGEVYNGPTPT